MGRPRFTGGRPITLAPAIAVPLTSTADAPGHAGSSPVPPAPGHPDRLRGSRVALSISAARSGQWRDRGSFQWPAPHSAGKVVSCQIRIRECKPREVTAPQYEGVRMVENRHRPVRSFLSTREIGARPRVTRRTSAHAAVGQPSESMRCGLPSRAPPPSDLRHRRCQKTTRNTMLSRLYTRPRHAPTGYNRSRAAGLWGWTKGGSPP